MCMCGDICCNSCGPAQGNSKCPICRVWASDGGCVDPIKCGLAELKAGYWESMIDLINAEYNDEILTKDQEKQLTAYRIMRKNSRKMLVVPVSIIERKYTRNETSIRS